MTDIGIVSASDPIIKDLSKKIKPRVQRLLAQRAPLLVENTKNALVFKGNNTSNTVVELLRDFAKLLKPNCKQFSRKNEIFPFEDATSLEFLTGKNDCSLFLMGCHSKKRPNNIVLGRMYDGHLLDMVEFGVSEFVSLSDIPGTKKSIAAKPMMIFQGDQWQSDNTFTRIQNIFLDFFRGVKVDKISLKGLDHVLSFSIVDGIIHIGGYIVDFKTEESSSDYPKTELKEMGPFLQLSLRRHQLAGDDLWKVACKKPKTAKPTKVKNVKETGLGEKVGRIHMKRQNLDRMGGRRVSALRNGGKSGKKRKNDSDSGSAGGNQAQKRTKNN